MTVPSPNIDRLFSRTDDRGPLLAEEEEEDKCQS
ncbi:hypothetical protein HFTV1-gp07 [Haloferax tailed virus 1]|uniref:Uncharacterized protein n=1 Tax=Haloferax tailed virus 1 TaxID=2507575 RepID=A0A410N6T3_HFTV1|nr:hypothetical protein M1M17_gp07 [Haloferax tailed virus 1]QAS68840.1 hypothetical protein HFTV1-gp07 [Haloferax tailed virus 1]